MNEFDLSIHVLESKKRCEEMGLDPNSIPSNHFSENERLNELRFQFRNVFKAVNIFTQKFMELIEGTPTLSVVTDENGTILEMVGDPTIKEMVQQLGFKPGVQFTEEISGTNSVSLALQLKQPVALVGSQHFHYFLHNTACYTVPFQFEENEMMVGTLSIMTFIEYQSPVLLAMLSSVVDSVEREVLLRKRNKELNILNQIVTDSSKSGIIMTDKNGHVTEFNQFAEELTGWSKTEVLTKQILELKPLGRYINKVFETETIYSDIDMAITNQKTGKKTFCLFDGRPIYDEKGRLVSVYAQFRDITERYENAKRINYMAYHDDLTGLPNRRFFREILNHELEKAKKNKSMLALFMLDLDRFKIINDTLGHENGDLLLVTVAQRLKKNLQNGTKIFRMGGDEFTIILPDVTQKSNVESFALALIDVFQVPFTLKGYEFNISASIGISFYPDHGQDIDTLLSKADTAMYRAKDQGKNNYMVYHSNMGNGFFEKLTFESELRNAIKKNHLELYYQPQIDLCSGQLIGVESLLRWNHPILGMIPPGDIIPLAEEMGLSVILGDWVLRTACQQLKTWLDMGYPKISIAVNLSPQEFLKKGLVERVKQILLETELEPQYLELEITESMTMDVDYSISILNSLNELGVKIAIDDFGTGYSSLNYLKNFPLHHLKIDRTFVNDIQKNKKDVKIISAIISMAHGLQLKVIAEGVETKEQALYLMDLKCDQAQGYYYSKPLPPMDIEKRIFNKNFKIEDINKDG